MGGTTRCGWSACAPGRAATCRRYSPGIRGAPTSVRLVELDQQNAEAARARPGPAGLERGGTVIWTRNPPQFSEHIPHSVTSG
jgi:hypothetical protein